MSKAKIMLLGTFHFTDGGHDAFKPQHDVGILSPRRQAEFDDVLNRLDRFRPTKIAVECRADCQDEVNADYQAFCNGALALGPDETHQIGFKLAKRIDHSIIYCVDVWGRYYNPAIDLEVVAHGRSPEEFNDYVERELDSDPVRDYAEVHNQTWIIDEWMRELQASGQVGDAAKMTRPLRETLLRMNSEEEILTSHSTYLCGPFKVGVGHEYPGVDFVCAWYNRNLRIFSNLQRITESSDDRVLLIIGSGHVPILRHCAMASSEYELVEVRDYLG
jgi:Family of unknown function (DUF5694)